MFTLINSCVLYWKPATWSLVFLMLICLTNKLFVLPITGIYLIIYVLIVAVSSTWLSLIKLQWFLQQNKPINLEKWFNLQHLTQSELTSPPQEVKKKEIIHKLSVDIDEYFIKKWFVYITKDTTFNEESQLILDEILSKIFSVQFNIDNQTVLQGILNVYLKHLKEFRRSLKRKEKYSGKISELYNYTHMCSTSTKTKDFFLNKLTTSLLNHFISWELANSLPYQVLVSIISKTALTYILDLLSNPEYFNYYLLSSFATQEQQDKLNLKAFDRVKIIEVTEKGTLTPNEPKKSLSNSNLQKEESLTIEEPPGLEIDSPEPVSAQKESAPPAPIDENVKIYEPRSCKTWYDSLDLNSVTLGEDILDGIDNSEPMDEPSSPLSSAKHLLDEMKQITNLETFKTSMKPISEVTVSTMNNIRDFQESTVNSVVKPVSNVTTSALNKIGGLHLQDEAAGMVEGILDFGRTKIRKGLRLTGLQDNPIEGNATKPIPIVSAKKPIPKMPHVKSQGEEIGETTWFNPMQDDVKIASEIEKARVPSILTQDDGSPDPEYEEAGDLASSIAKLRSLLEQKSSESTLSTPSGLSPMPPDDISSKILLEDIVETDGMMPSFYKFCTKTATGVLHNTLNTIKTALPGVVNEADKFELAEKWLFVEAGTKDSDLSTRMDKLVCERKEFCTVDTAYEAIDSLASIHSEIGKNNKLNIQFEDELDDFEVKLPVSKVVCDIFSELLADSKDTPLTQEPVIKSILLLFGNVMEEQIVYKTKLVLNNWYCNDKIPKGPSKEILTMEFDEFIDVLLKGIPDYIKYLIGDKTLMDTVKLFVSSLQVQKINQDMVLQIFEIICLKLMEGSKQLSPVTA